MAKKSISIIVGVRIAISRYLRPSGKASGSELGGRWGEGENISCLTSDIGC